MRQPRLGKHALQVQKQCQISSFLCVGLLCSKYIQSPAGEGRSAECLL